MKKEKQNRRRKLLIPLFFSSLLLMTTTFAWFSANRMVSIDSLNVHVQTDGGLEVSTNAIDWKQVVTVSDIMSAREKYSGSVNQLPYRMNPVSSGGNVSDGKLELFVGNATNSVDNFILVADRSMETEGFGEESDGNFIAFDVFFRVNSSKELYLDGSSKVEYTGDANSGIENATRIAFITEGSSADNPSISQSLNNGLDVVIWEPNYDVHTEYGVSHARDVYGISTSLNGASRLSYDGVTAVIPSNLNIPISSANAGTYPGLFKNVGIGIETPKNGGANQKIADLQPSVTKMRIYMWIEGQDVDCEDNASYGDITFDLKFTINPS